MRRIFKNGPVEVWRTATDYGAGPVEEWMVYGDRKDPVFYPSEAAAREAAEGAVDERVRLAAEYVELVGYDPFADDPKRSADEVRRTLSEYKVARNFSKGEER